MSESDIDRQRDYYRRTASEYDVMHMEGDAEHQIALGWLTSLIDMRGYRSLLDIGSGTGRVLRFLKERGIDTAVGIEPVAELREIGHQAGLTADELTDGDATALPFPDNSFDIVCEFATLHHIKDHRAAVAEMCRVARHAVFLSDSNNFGQGRRAARLVKRGIDRLGLWGAYDWLATRGKGYHWSEGDGLFYSYSIFRDVPVLQRKFGEIRYLTTQPAKGADLRTAAPHLAVFASHE